jgi:peroxiredoxin
MSALFVLTSAVTPLGVSPEFTFTSQEGTPVSLKDCRGKSVVLYFYPKDFARGCERS